MIHSVDNIILNYHFNDNKNKELSYIKDYLCTLMFKNLTNENRL